MIRIMFLRSNRRFKDGKEHRYWNIVENKRCAGGKVVQRQVLKKGTWSTLQAICDRAPLIRLAFSRRHPLKIAVRVRQLVKLG